MRGIRGRWGRQCESRINCPSQLPTLLNSPRLQDTLTCAERDVMMDDSADIFWTFLTVTLPTSPPSPPSWAIGEVVVVIEMVVDEKDDREVYKVRKVVTKEWTKANSSDTGFLDF